MDAAEVIDPARGFANLMSQAAEEADEGKDEAPYGYTRDRETGEMRPKKAPGRGGRRSPSVEDLKEQAAQAPADGPPLDGDRPPDAKAGRRGRGKTAGEDKPPVKVIEWHEGQISRGVNKLYRKAGKIIKVMDPAVGAALVSITRKDEPDDVTVGEAWEDLARTNPRIRKVLLKMIAGGAWGQLLMAHAPVLLALLMKDSVRKLLPFDRVFEAFLSDDSVDGEVPADGTPLEGLTMPDFAQMQAMAQQVAQQMAGQMARGQAPRAPQAPEMTPEEVAEYAAYAAGQASGEPPPDFRPPGT